ncbi:MAG: flagellin [Oceanicoccus sp.]
MEQNMVQGIGQNPPGLQRSLIQSQNTQQTAAERIGSGKQVNSAGDNAAGLAIISRLVSQNEGFSQAIRNAVDGVSYAQVAGGTLSTVTDDAQRIRQLSLQAANGILSDSDRSTLQSEVSQLQEGIASRLQDAQFNGVDLFTSSDKISFQVGDKANDTIEFAGSDFGSDIDALLTIDVSTQAGASSALEGVDNFIESVSSRQGELGAIINRFESTVNNLQTSRINGEQSRSRLQDADIAKEVSDNVRGGIQQQAAIALQAQANIDSALVLRLLS